MKATQRLTLLRRGELALVAAVLEGNEILNLDFLASTAVSGSIVGATFGVVIVLVVEFCLLLRKARAFTSRWCRGLVAGIIFGSFGGFLMVFIHWTSPAPMESPWEPICLFGGMFASVGFVLGALTESID